MKEAWKPVVGYGGLYEVSTLGNIKSLIRHNGTSERILKPFKDEWGYPKVKLTKNKVEWTVKIHRLVAQAFIPNPDNKPQVNHKNGIKNDNRVENLEWCTQSENNKHAFRTGLNSIPDNSGSKNGRSKLDEKKVGEIISLLPNLKNRDIAIMYDVNPTTISEIRNNKIWRNIQR